MTGWRDGYTQPDTNLCQVAAYGSLQQPVTARQTVQSSCGLVKRLAISNSYPGHSGSVHTLDWNAAGDLLISGGDDCRVKIWSTENGQAQHAFDSGHTSSIYAARFMPNTGDAQVITAAGDRQIRHVNLQRNAIKPYCCHTGKVRALVPLDQNIFISGSDDGTARHVDLREPSSSCDVPGLRTGDIIACQQHERNSTFRGKAKLGINAIAVDPLRPHLFVTGSMDPLVRLYDRRMHASRLPGQTSSGSSWPMWVSCYIPATFKAGNADHPSTRRRFLTSVKFSAAGDQIFASYSGDHIYSFDTVAHARESHLFYMAQGWHRSRPRSGTRSASRHAVLQTSAPETAPRIHSTPYANSAVAPQQRPASARTAMTAPRPQSGASQHQAGTSHSAGSGQPSLGSGGLSEAAVAAVAQIRRRRSTAQNTQAGFQGLPTAAPGIALTNTAPIVDFAGVDMTVGSRSSRDSGSAHSNAAGISRPLHRSLTGLSVHHGATAAAAANNEQALTTDQQAVTQPPAQSYQSVPESVSNRLEAAAPSGQAAVIDKAQWTNRPPLPCSVTRRSARLLKAAAGSPPDQMQQDTADAKAQAAAANSPHSSFQGSVAGARPVTRHACKRKLAEATVPCDADSPDSSKAREASQPSMPAPAGMQRPRHATGATLPADAHDTADGAALLPAIASTEGASGQIQMQAGPNACCDLPQTEHTLPDRPAGSAMLSGPRQLRAAPPSARHLHLVPPTALAAPSQELLSAGQAATAVRLGHDARLQQHLQPDHSFHTEFAEAATGSTQPLEQPTASTGTSRPDPQWFPATSMQIPQGGSLAAVPAPADFLRLRYSTEPPISADQSRENSPEQAQQAARQPAQASHPMHPGLVRLPRQLRSSRLAPQAAADHKAASSSRSPDSVAAAMHAGACLELASADGAADSGSQPKEGTGVTAGPNVADGRHCDSCGRSDLDASAQPRERTPASSICRQTSMQARGRASVEASTQGVRRQRSSSTVNNLQEASTRRSRDHITQLDASHDDDLHMQSAEVCTAPGQAVLSSSLSSRASQPNAPHTERLLSALDAHSSGIGNGPHQADQSSTAHHQADQESHAGNAIPGAGRLPGTFPVPEVTQAGPLASIHNRTRQQDGSSAQLHLQHQHSRHVDQSASGTTPTEQTPSQDRLLQSQPISNLGQHHTEANRDAPGLHQTWGLSNDDPEVQQAPSRPHSPRAVASFVGAILHGGSPDEDEGEVVEERDMFQQCYKGHCNVSESKELCLMGSKEGFVASGSDDGRIFIWDRQSGRLVNMLHGDDRNVFTVAAHPHMPMLASSGADSVVKCWSPQAEEPCKLDRAAAIMASNARELAEGSQRGNMAGAPPIWLDMLGTAVHAELAGQDDAAAARGHNPVRCTIM